MPAFARPGSHRHLPRREWLDGALLAFGRDLEAAGELRRVRIPVGPGRDLRKLLFDRQDLDHLLEVWKDLR